jgi:hypothetical protein
MVSTMAGSRLFMVSKVLCCALSLRRFGGRSGAALYALQQSLVEMAQDRRIDHQMPTDVDRCGQLLQNLAVGIGAIREAIERAFGVTLPTAPKVKRRVRDYHERNLRGCRPTTTSSAD